MYHHLDSVRRRVPVNAAYLHPEDLASLGLSEGESVRIESAHGSVTLPTKADPALRRQVVQVPHGWGDVLDGATDHAAPGVNTNVLTSATCDLDPINAMPCLTGLPVRLRAATSPSPIGVTS
jgi:anaerobic selenocysteine-containing dehydrogenase